MTSAATPNPPVGTPIYGCGFGLAVKRFFKGYVTFTGKASRSEFWRACLVIVIIATCLAIATVIVSEVVVGSVIDEAMSSSSLSDAERTAIETAFIGVFTPFIIVCLTLTPPLFGNRKPWLPTAVSAAAGASMSRHR